MRRPEKQLPSQANFNFCENLENEIQIPKLNLFELVRPKPKNFI